MRKSGVLLAILAITIGSLWALQGLGLVGGSFMTGSSTWLWIGLVTAGAGLAALAMLLRADTRR
jgi:hypothetical protein